MEYDRGTLNIACVRCNKPKTANVSKDFHVCIANTLAGVNRVSPRVVYRKYRGWNKTAHILKRS